MQKYSLKHKCSVISHEQIAQGHYLLSFPRSENFLAGQILAITTSPNIPARLYSIASGEDEENYTIYYNIFPEGALTSQLVKLKKGDTFWHSSPFGKFTFPHPKSFFIATGTGISPFLAKIKSGKDFSLIKLLHGARSCELLLAMDLFSEILENNYIKCISSNSEQKTENTFFGRVTSYLQTQQNLPLDYHYYLCGKAEMVVQTRDILLSKGIPFQQILAEIYF